MVEQLTNQTDMVPAGRIEYTSLNGINGILTHPLDDILGTWDIGDEFGS